MKSKLIILFLMILFFTSVTYAFKSNESYENLILDQTGWCAGIEIEFRIYNETEYNNRVEIENELCAPDEDPEEDYCKDGWDYIDNAEVRIYDGPFTSSKHLLNTTSDENGTFKFTFAKEGNYLISVDEDGKYNTLETTLFIDSCPWANADLNSEQNSETLYNQTFEFSNVGMKIQIEDTDMINSSEIIVTPINRFSSKGLIELENVVKTIEINSTSETYSKLTLEIDVVLNSNVEVNVYKNNNGQWTEVSYTEGENKVIIENAQEGIYSVTSVDKVVEEIPIVEINENSSSSEMNENNSIVNSNLDNNENSQIENANNTEASSSLDLVSVGLVIGGILALGIAGFVFYSKRHKLTGVGSSSMAKKEEESKQGEEVLKTYNDIYNRAKSYVQTYKDNYGKDQIYRALEGANVPKDIIDKIFLEVYE